MAELVREIMIDATPDTIWPFLTDPAKHVEWLGTSADIDPRPGGVYRVLVGGQNPSSGEYVEVVPMAKVVRFHHGRRPSRSPFIARATKPVFASPIADCPTTQSTITAAVGRTT